MILEKVPAALRGDLSKWMLEPKTGVFVGTLSAVVREMLWDRLRERSRNGACIMIHSDSSEQGFSMRMSGIPSRELIDFDGLTLIRIPK